MADTPTEILTKMISIMHNSGLYTTLTGYTIGIFPYIDIQNRYSVCQLAILDSFFDDRESFNNDGYYNGQAIFEVLGQDNFALTGTPPTATAETFVATVAHVTNFMELFSKEANHDLATLALSNGGRVEFIDLDQNVQYLGVDRDNNYQNRGIITFQVRTREPKN